jgi:hypothetical protein
VEFEKIFVEIEDRFTPQDPPLKPSKYTCPVCGNVVIKEWETAATLFI